MIGVALLDEWPSLVRRKVGELRRAEKDRVLSRKKKK
jgi:hypothetical protein